MIWQNVQNEAVLLGVSSYNNIIIKTGKLESTVQRKQSIANVFITALAALSKGYCSCNINVY